MATTPELLRCPVLGLDDDWPHELFVVHHPASGRYACFCHEGVFGLACFSSEEQAVTFGKSIEVTGMKTLRISFDEARDVAAGRPLPVVAVILLDSFAHPLVHFVR